VHFTGDLVSKKSAPQASPAPTTPVADPNAERDALKVEIRAEVEAEWRASFDEAVRLKAEELMKAYIAKQPPAPAAPAPAKNSPVPIRYIGHRPTYKEGAYGTGIIFTKGKSEFVPADKAAQLLAHKDVYEPGDASECGAVQAVPVKKDESDDPTQMARDAIAISGKEALEAYARVNFNVDLDKRQPVEALRSQVTGLIDQFGVA
jgi:hypothetical protein